MDMHVQSIGVGNKSQDCDKKRGERSDLLSTALENHLKDEVEHFNILLDTCPDQNHNGHWLTDRLISGFSL